MVRGPNSRRKQGTVGFTRWKISSVEQNFPPKLKRANLGAFPESMAKLHTTEWVVRGEGEGGGEADRLNFYG